MGWVTANLTIAYGDIMWIGGAVAQRESDWLSSNRLRVRFPSAPPIIQNGIDFFCRMPYYVIDSQSGRNPKRKQARGDY